MNNRLPLALHNLDHKNKKRAQQLAQQLNLILLEDPSEAALLLQVSADKVELIDNQQKKPSAFSISFSSGKAAHRRQFGGGRNQPLARAIGLKKGATPSVVDATAGLGRDAFVLATLGCHVTMIERSPIIALLLQQALEEGSHNNDIRSICQRLSLVNQDASDYLLNLPSEQHPEVIYLDPMYPGRQKKAQVKKEMQLLQTLLGKDLDSEQLLAAALKTAQKRVVVKRPKGAEPLTGQAPHSCIESPNTRYDLYPIHSKKS
ncbi:MAG: class I SAM-dependent methyltransferase [Gammaproteobacteria bacterium]|nr:class I SAM-dependent methyltransferase [Gammaproteobacteria bacterium]